MNFILNFGNPSMLASDPTSWSLLRVCFVVGILSLWLLLALNIERTDLALFVPHVHFDSHANESLSQIGYLVNTNGCRIPDMDPMDPHIQHYFTEKATLDCTAGYGPPLVYSDETTLYINQSALSHYANGSHVDVNDLSCCYTPFWRVVTRKRAHGEQVPRSGVKVRYAKCTPFDNATTNIMDEFLRVECFLNNNSIYTDFHSFPHLKNEADKVNRSHNREAVSVLIIGVDAMSRLNFQRQMPQTLKFLKKTLGAAEMFGYNKVDDNTFPNLVPVLSGLSVDELKQVCWPSSDAYFDDCNLIWKNFSAAGFRTAFGEDASWMGIFNYVKKGFYDQPTDYYMNPFNSESEIKIGHEHRLNAKLCVGPRKTVETLLSYAYKFSYAMRDMLSFGFFWGASLTHDYLNYGRFGDTDHKDFLQKLHEIGIFNRTVLIFMSDHGLRWGSFRGTYQGYLEERLPFVFISYPEWFRIKYTTAISNLKRNAHRLTTPFDLHEVLRDLVNLTRLENDVLKSRSEDMLRAKIAPRGISMFLPVSVNRNCADAGVSDHWCTCHQSVDVSVNDTAVKDAAVFLVKNINSLLANYSQCATLNLSKIITSREEISLSHSSFKISDAGIKDFSLTIETVPGNALFEATIRHHGNTNSFALVGSTSRINLYGDQSKCVSNYKLRLYCYCINGWF